MDECSIIKCLKKRRVIVSILVFFQTLIFLTSILDLFSPSVVYADVSGSNTGVTSMNIKFNDKHTEATLGYTMGYVPVLNVTMGSQLSSYDFTILDCNGNVLVKSIFQGELPTESSRYPLTIRINPISSAPTWYMNVKITFKEEAQALDEVISKMDMLSDKLDKLKEKLQSIFDTLASMRSTLESLNDFLSNPAYLNSGLDELNNSINNLSNKRVINNSSNASNLQNLNASGGSDGFSCFFDYMGIHIQLLDFSAISSQLGAIRALLTAMLWIEFAVFCIRIVLPHFKV